jgi:VanZ family protein
MQQASPSCRRQDNPQFGSRILLAMLAYLVLLLYGSLYPFQGWRAPVSPFFSFLRVWPSHLDKADLVQNVLVYAPFGLLAALWLSRAMRLARALLLAVALGTLLSLAVECLQQLNPARVASVVDIAMNSLGAACGAMLSTAMLRHTFSGAVMLTWRDHWFKRGALANTGLVIFAFWLLSQTSPLVPTLDVGHFRHALSGLFHALQDPRHINLPKLVNYACDIAALGIIALLLSRPERPVMTLFVLAVACVLLAKVVVVSRVLSLEAAGGAALGIAACAGLRIAPRRLFPFFGMLLAMGGFTVSELISVRGGIISSFNWIPFAGQMRTYAGLENILELLWPFMAISWFARIATPRRVASRAMAVGAVLVTAAVFALEWRQQWLPGRYGDITQVLLCLVGWTIPWCVHEDNRDDTDGRLIAGRVHHA